MDTGSLNSCESSAGAGACSGFAESERFRAAINRFDQENARDPNKEIVAGGARPRELVYSEWLTEWVDRLNPTASEPLRLAARCQHLCRWQVPRESYPQTREGYLRWREQLKRFHARKAAAILRDVGYSEETVVRVMELNLKKNFPADPEGRVLEDALCLVFLEHQFGPLTAKASEEKMFNALRKTWKKMNPAARDLALQLNYAPREKSLLYQALGLGGE